MTEENESLVADQFVLDQILSWDDKPNNKSYRFEDMVSDDESDGEAEANANNTEVNTDNNAIGDEGFFEEEDDDERIRCNVEIISDESGNGNSTIQLSQGEVTFSISRDLLARWNQDVVNLDDIADALDEAQ